MNPEDIKKCSKCLIHKSTKNDFHTKQSICKTCRINKDKENRNEKDIKERIKERTPYRNELFKRCLKEGCDMQSFNKFFIPFEIYEEMKKQNDSYSFCESSNIKEMDRDKSKDDYDNKMFLDCVMVSNRIDYTAYVAHII